MTATSGTFVFHSVTAHVLPVWSRWFAVPLFVLLLFSSQGAISVPVLFPCVEVFPITDLGPKAALNFLLVFE